MKYLEGYGWVLYESWERIPLKMFPFSMAPLPKLGIGIRFIITSQGILQSGGTKGQEKFTKFNQLKDFDAESGRI